MRNLTSAARITLLLLLVAQLLLSGCWSRIEINDRLLVVAMFIDEAADNSVQLTLGYAKPNQISSQSGGEAPSTEAPYATVSGKGRNISEAYRNIQTNISREIFWGQVKMIVVGETCARKGLAPLLDFVDRKSGIPLKTYILVAKGEAREVADFPTQIEKFPSEVFRELVTRKKVISGSVKHFLTAEEYGRGMILGYVAANTDKSSGTQITVLGSALFQDSAMTGKMDSYTTRGAMWLRGNIKDAVITFASPTDGKLISILVMDAKSKIVPHVRGSEISYTLQLDVESIIDSSESAIDLEDPSVLSNLESLLSEQIEERIQKAFQESQKSATDAYQLGAYLAWYYPKVWKASNKDWSSIYKERVRLNVETKARIRLMGAMKNPEEAGR
ncbi:Ger(x)C family spore germination protein [Paenibacillus sp. S150]|uniref:Ger(x)C family spore germination protein n=1 Tax=Paenibacillus sp. S150 TaxID=2749826 RepID=UPI001C56D142|nr:Ger(x)C family spore germination protein [Paenibacillus sp. S150]MBW4083615.1 Ger(x)C family spore germination protein [Paenibacillus sp. S150]